MKEKIYTIPVTEAFETDCGCPLCFLEEKLEKEAVEYALGAAMMEPDYRIVSNEKGYCRRHFEMLFKSTNKLSLALTLETHLEEIRKKLNAYEKEISTLESGKSGLFKKSNSGETADKIGGMLEKITDDCLICEKLSSTMERYCDVLLYMWANDESFKKKFHHSNGICLKHSEQLIRSAPKSLGDTHAREFISMLYRKQKEELAAQQELLHKFVLKFDYRYHDMELGKAQNAVSDTIEKISGYMKKE